MRIPMLYQNVFLEVTPPLPATLEAGLARNRVKIATRDLYIKHNASLRKIRVQEKPTKRVLCKYNAKQGELKFVG